MVDALKKKQTINSTALRLGTFRLVFSGSFLPYTCIGQWNNRPLGSFDMNSPLETLGREVTRTADKNTSQVEICTVCDYKNYPFFHCRSAHKALMKRNTSSVVGFIVVALYNTSNTLYNCMLQQRKFQGRTANSWQEIFTRRQLNFSRQVNVTMKVLGLR